MNALPLWAPAQPHRFGAAVLAVGITACFLALLRLQPPASQLPASTTVAVLLRPLSIPSVPSTPQEAAPKPASVSRPSVVPSARVALPRESDTRIIESIPPSAGAGLPTTPSPSTAASQPQPLQLQLSSGAAKAARGNVRSMADSAGTYIGDERASSQERMAEEVAKAGKTDCLAPNANGSLLSAVVIAYEAATGKCK